MQINPRCQVDEVPSKIRLKLTVYITESYVRKITNDELSRWSFSENPKTAAFEPMHEKSRNKINYRSLGLLNALL